jgi:hypothetical protein
MANDTLINLLAWCKRERERLQMQREMLQYCRIGWDHSWVHSLMPSDDPVTLGLVSTRQQQNSR